MNDLKSKLMGGAYGTSLPPGPASPEVLNALDVRVPAPNLRPGQKPKNVMICVPSGRSWEARTASFIAGMVAYSAYQGVSIGICNVEGSMITKSRNDSVQIALDKGAEYIMWIDSDMVGPPDTLMRLLAHERDVVGATYNKRVPPYETLGRLKGKMPETLAALRAGGLREAETMPGGMMLIKTDVYRRMRWPYYYESYEWPGETGTDTIKNFLRDNYEIEPPADVLESLDGTRLGDWLNTYYASAGKGFWYFSEDLNWCRKVRKLGVRIWCDLTLTFELTHLGVMPVSCLPPSVPEDDPIAAAVM